jgi:hypothetical protein
MKCRGAITIAFCRKNVLRSSGTAETAVYIQKGPREGGTAEVSFLDNRTVRRYSSSNHLMRRSFSL